MSNALRNSIILTILLILMLSGFLLVHRRYNKQAGILEAQNKKTEATIADLDEQISKRDSLMAAYEIMLEMQSQQSKILVGSDSANQSYQYLLRVLKWMGKYIPFNFALTDASKKQAAYNEYVISGRTHYSDLIKLTKHLEYERAVITIEDFSIGSDTVAASDTVSFSMVFRTHFQEGGPELESITNKDFNSPWLGYQLFNIRIYDSIPEREIDPRLVNISDATLIGLGDGKAFLRDKQGIIHILSPGSKVAYGYLREVDMPNGRAVFKLNLHGLEETHFLQVRNLP